MLALVACSTSDNTIDRTFDPCAFDIADQRGVTDALALWHVAPNRDGEMIALEFQQAALSFHGLYDDATGIVYVNDAITDPRALSIVIAHELGHAFGLPHKSGEPSLMNRGNTTIAPTDGDFADLAARWADCPISATSSGARLR